MPSFSNPIPRGVRTRYYEASPLRSPRDSDGVPRGWQKNKKVETGEYRVAQAIEQLQRQINRLRNRGGVGEGGGGRALVLYDKSASWSPGRRVVLLPTHELVTTGLLDDETDVLVKAPAGIYCCQKRAVPVPIDPGDLGAGYKYNAPKHPTESPDDLEAASTYWWLESLYVDTNITCDPDTNEETEIYVNAQPIPVQP